MAQQLDQLNRERRRIEGEMLDEALLAAAGIEAAPGAAAALFEAGWHQGVVGILASRLRERLHRPVVCFARAGDGANAGLLRGSGRSIPGLHLRDCLDLVAKREPGLILRFGGHAQAAGLTLRERDFERFAEAFERAAADTMPPEALAPVIESDGALDPAHVTLGVAQLLEEQIWGQGFPQPLFCDTFSVESQRVVGERHLKLRLARDGRRFDAIRFNAVDPRSAQRGVGSQIRAAYRLTVNEFNGLKNVQLNVEHIEA
jgi:single-stranded-DNA-specific exonuclease